MFIGIDLGQHRVHVVALDARMSLSAAIVIDASDLDALEPALAGASAIAIDAPEALSTAPHATEETLSPKFRTARCAEIALGRQHKIWVPWVTPVQGAPVPGWMDVGFRVFDIARRGTGRVVEVFPHAAFTALAGSKVPSKTTAVGISARVELLIRAGVRVEGLEVWSHDSLDACVAAAVARDVARSAATKASCEHDGSAIWLPSPPWARKC